MVGGIVCALTHPSDDDACGVDMNYLYLCNPPLWSPAEPALIIRQSAEKGISVSERSICAGYV